ncbi:MAG: class I SAM-dependent methyltransferase [Bdellovibrionales bacterium]
MEQTATPPATVARLPDIASTPTLLVSDAWQGGNESYRLIDSGEGRKLEQVGPYLFDRPEPQCLWPKADAHQWTKADARFAAKDEEGEAGQWIIKGKIPTAWELNYRKLPFYARLMNNRHIGFFPEQAAQWDEIVATITPGFKMLNAFAYTGLLSLLAAQAGADVTHVDASKKAIEWGKENAQLAGIDTVRWICEDARAFVAREGRRDKKYDGIVLDPPKFGRGPDGEVWEFFDHMPDLMRDAAAVLSDNAKFFIITGYSARLSPRSLAELLASHLGGRGGTVSYGECALPDKAGRCLSLNMYAKWARE